MSQDKVRANWRTRVFTRSIPERFLQAGAGRATEYFPRFYLEAKIDLADVRSGFRESLSVNRALDIVPLEEDVLWTEDMVHAVDPGIVADGPPHGAKLRPLPDFVNREHLRQVERQFLSYLLRYFEIQIYRNPALNLYSTAGESRADFEARCLDSLQRSFRQDLDGLREVFERRIEKIKERSLRTERWVDPEPDKLTTQTRNRIHEASGRIADLFLRAELGQNPPACARPGFLGDDLDNRLAWIEAEASEAVRRLIGQYLGLAGDLDEYAVRPSLKDVHVGAVSILWVPVEAFR